jgi:phosphoglycolate phosphatase
MIELVMFDADGVLFDSDQSNVAYYNAIFTQMNEPVLDPNEEVKALSYATMQVFETRARGDAEKLRLMRQLARDLDPAPFFQLLKPPFVLRPFMIELKRRYKLALATNRSGTVHALIEHLELADLFDAVASAHDRVKPKPAPDILELCLERAGVRPERAVYVGDSQIDRVAAEAAGVQFIGIGVRVEHHRRIPTLHTLPETIELLIASLS